MKVYEALAAACRRQGAHVAFGLVGDGNVKFVHHWANGCDGRYIATRHESAAVSMAVGYSRSTGRAGLATVTQGPGLTNALTALTAGAKARVPLVLVTGMPPTTLPGHPQAIDQEALLTVAGAGSQPVSPMSVERDVAEAFDRARGERRPIAVCVPTDVQDGESEDTVQPSPPESAEPVVRVPAEPSSVAVAAELVESAACPLIVAGRGVLASPGAREALIRLGGRIGALLATTLPIRGFFAGHPYGIGVMGGFASDLALEQVARADLVLAFGSSLNYRSTRSGRLLDDGAVVVQCDIDAQPSGASIVVDHRLVGDAAATADALTDELERRGLRTVGGRSQGLADRLRRGAVHDGFEDLSPKDQVDPRALMQRLDDLLPEQRSVTVDGGHSSGFPSIYLRVPDHHGYLFSLEFAAIGLGLGTAMGAAVGRPDRVSVLVIGDGALMMSLPDIETAARHGLPLLIVVMNDQAYTSELAILAASDLPPGVGLFDNPSFADTARALGARGLTVRSIEDLDALPATLPELEGPLVVDCALDATVRGAWLEGSFDRTLAVG